MNILERVTEDKTLSFIKNGYLFQDRLRASLGLAADDPRPIKTHALGKPALLVRGSKGVDLFYDRDLVNREGAMPNPIADILFGEGAIHRTDGERFEARKKMFVSIAYDPAQAERFARIAEPELRAMGEQWTQRRSVVYKDTILAYGRAVLRWADVPEGDINEWAPRLAQIVDGFGTDMKERARALYNRRKADEWAAGLVQKVRDGEIHPEPETALYVVSHFREPNGELMDPKLAGIELQNSTRPAIAVSRFAAFAARAVAEHPQYIEAIRAEAEQSGTIMNNPLAHAFANEVRRVYPFVPMLPAVARTSFDFEGEHVAEGDLILIDISGTMTDPNEWTDAHRFYPERFLGQDFEEIPAFIPQGGSSVYTGHRCPGEKIALSELSATITLLCQEGVEVDPTGLDIDMTALPTKPTSGGLVRPA